MKREILFLVMVLCILICSASTMAANLLSSSHITPTAVDPLMGSSADMIDNDTDTYAASWEPFLLELDETYHVKEVRLWLSNMMECITSNGQCVTDYYVQYWDGDSWETPSQWNVSGANICGCGSWQTRTLTAAVSTTKLKVTITAHPDSVHDFHEAQVYVEAGAAWSAPTATENDGIYATNVSTYNATTIQTISSFSWHRNNMARIRYNANVNLSGLSDLDPVIEVGTRMAYVNSSAAGALNKSADITFYGVNCEDQYATRIYYSESAYTLDGILGSGRLCTDCLAITCVGGAQGNLTFTVTHFTGYASGSNANLTIFDEIETDGTKYIAEAVEFFANYSNSGSHISGAACNISFDDAPGTWYVMTDNGANYNFTKAAGFASGGTLGWNVTCDHASYSQLETNDTIFITVPPIPEFSGMTILIALLGVLVAAGIIRKAK